MRNTISSPNLCLCDKDFQGLCVCVCVCTSIVFVHILYTVSMNMYIGCTKWKSHRQSPAPWTFYYVNCTKCLNWLTFSKPFPICLIHDLLTFLCTVIFLQRINKIHCDWLIRPNLWCSFSVCICCNAIFFLKRMG